MPHGHDDRERKPAAPARRGRRTFLKLAAGTAVLGALHPLVGRTSRVVAAWPGPQPVGIEDLELGPGALARGTFHGTSAEAGGVTLADGARRGRYVSPVLSAGGPFTHIGLHWTADGGGIDLEVRSAAATGGWSPWEPLLIEHHVPEGTAETFGALLSVEEHDRLQFRATLDASGGPPPLLADVTATLINVHTGQEQTSGALGLTALSDELFSPEEAETREDWGVGDSSHPWTRAYVPVKKVVVHHTATTNNYSPATAPDEVRAIWAYHANSLGWGDIGYNAIVDRYGTVYEGRRSRGEGGVREILGPEVVAGHALGHNYGTTGVALLGTFTARGEGGRPGGPPPDAMWQRLVDVVAWECDRHHLDPDDATDFLRTDGAWNRGLPNVPGHRDCVASICPGGEVYARLDDLREAVAARLGRSAPAVELVGPVAETVDTSDADELEFSWSAEGASGLAYLLEGWSRSASDPDGIDELSGYTSDHRPDWRNTDHSSASFASLFEEFGHADQMTAGQYTFHVRALDGSSSGYAARQTLLVTGEPTAPPATGSIEGTVTGDEGEPIAGATVAVDDTSLSDTTGSDGRYAIVDVPEGEHDVTASAEGFESQTQSATVEPDQTTALDFALVAEGSDDDDPPVGELAVTGIDPDAIRAGESLDVTIEGSGFVEGATVNFENGQGPQPSASDFQVVNAETITATVSVSGGGPPRDRAWDVRVTNPDGASDVLVGGLTVSR